ncbi:DUF417 family protein [Mycolicibacterium smegmatis]|uniref:DUF417 family protein n=1 Tax=Mycolicibacterium smegmatis TaxID=1772 RepID=UPI003A0FE5AF
MRSRVARPLAVNRSPSERPVVTICRASLPSAPHPRCPLGTSGTTRSCPAVPVSSRATVSFLFTTPGVGEPAGGGFPALSSTGQFLLKDVPLLGLSLWTLVDAVKASRNRAR